MTHSRHRNLILKNMQLGLDSCFFLSRQFLNGLRENVKHLDLSNNNLRDRGVSILSACMGEENKTLVSLNLASNSITHEGAAVLFNALKKN